MNRYSAGDISSSIFSKKIIAFWFSLFILFLSNLNLARFRYENARPFAPISMYVFGFYFVKIEKTWQIYLALLSTKNKKQVRSNYVPCLEQSPTYFLLWQLIFFFFFDLPKFRQSIRNHYPIYQKQQKLEQACNGGFRIVPKRLP